MNHFLQSAVRNNWFRPLILLFTFILFLSFILPACAITGDPAIDIALWITLILSPFSSDNDDYYTDDWVYCSNQILRLRIYNYSNADGLLIPNSYVRIFNQDAEKIDYDAYQHTGNISVRFRSYDTPEALLPCWGLCEDSDVETFGHTQCLEEGQTWELGVEAYAEGYASYADTLTLDNQSVYEVMTFFLDPL